MPVLCKGVYIDRGTAVIHPLTLKQSFGTSPAARENHGFITGHAPVSVLKDAARTSLPEIRHETRWIMIQSPNSAFGGGVTQ